MRNEILLTLVSLVDGYVMWRTFFFLKQYIHSFIVGAKTLMLPIIDGANQKPAHYLYSLIQILCLHEYITTYGTQQIREFWFYFIIFFWEEIKLQYFVNKEKGVKVSPRTDITLFAIKYVHYCESLTILADCLSIFNVQLFFYLGLCPPLLWDWNLYYIKLYLFEPMG